MHYLERTEGWWSNQNIYKPYLQKLLESYLTVLITSSFVLVIQVSEK